MSTSTHSPAPWSLRGDILRDANGTLLYRLTPLDEITIAQDDANRRLIEAGPEMADALRDVCDALEIMLKINRLNPGDNLTLQEARSLIAKLEGAA